MIQKNSPDLALALVQLMESENLSRELRGKMSLFDSITQPGGRPGLVKYAGRRVDCATTSW